jgi:hypothetical protein
MDIYDRVHGTGMSKVNLRDYEQAPLVIGLRTNIIFDELMRCRTAAQEHCPLQHLVVLLRAPQLLNSVKYPKPSFSILKLNVTLVKNKLLKLMRCYQNPCSRIACDNLRNLENTNCLICRIGNLKF